MQFSSLRRKYVHKYNCNNKFTNCYNSQNIRISNGKNEQFTSTALCVLTHRLNPTYQQDGCIAKLFAILYTWADLLIPGLIFL